MSTFTAVVKSGHLMPDSHTRAMSVVMDNFLFVIARLKVFDVVRGNLPKPTGRSRKAASAYECPNGLWVYYFDLLQAVINFIFKCKP